MRTYEKSNFGLLFFFTLLMLAVAAILFADPVSGADLLDIKGQQETAYGIVARYTVPSASSAGETPVLNVERFKYATVQITSATGDPAFGSADGIFQVKGSAIPTATAEYLVAIPYVIESTSPANIVNYGNYTFELGALNRLSVEFADNTGEKEIIISLTRERN
jgi:hypothetical protein